ncbi:hypothetical protein [Trinickia fusca]|uniref:hypothetical protein n=1 Tax=Trinickia fusca TaxID=2419777 RepID=UPI0011C38E1F|nr:hypothetical protein [Trinickia fusca]
MRIEDHASTQPLLDPYLSQAQTRSPAMIPASPEASGHVAIDMPDIDGTAQPSATPSGAHVDAGATVAQAGPESTGAWAARHGRNFLAIGARNLVSVFAPTAAREAVRRFGLQSVCAASPALSNALGGLALAVPIGLHIGGIARDCRDGTMNRLTLASRVTHIVMLGSTGAALIALGGLATAGPALAAANFVYTPLRDAFQHQFNLGDNTTGAGDSTMKATLVAAPTYAVNQFIVGEAMDGLSDLIAGGLGQHLPESIAQPLANMIGRAAVNWAGETADEITLRGAQASIEGTQLEVGLTWRPLHASAENPGFEHSRQAAGDRLLNSHAGRDTLFGSAFANAYSANAGGLSSHAGNAVVGATLGIGYVPFIGAHLQSPRPAERDVEASLPENAQAPAAPAHGASVTEFHTENEIELQPWQRRGSQADAQGAADTADHDAASIRETRL